CILFSNSAISTNIVSSITVSYKLQKHFLIVTTGVLANGTIERDTVPPLILISNRFQINFRSGGHHSCKVFFMGSSPVDSQTENLRKVLLRMEQALRSCS
ncbi:hypothetical protein VIGAN_03170100, partial [Vigna angularis var. angularis]